MIGLALLLAAAAPSAAGPALPLVEVAPTDPRATAAVDRLMAASSEGDGKTYESMMESFIDALLPVLVQGNSGGEQRIRAILGEELLGLFKQLQPDVRRKSREVYLRRFTASELEELARQSETPLGRKVAREMPAIQAELFAFGRSAGQAAVQGAMPRILERMRAANLRVPQSS